MDKFIVALYENANFPIYLGIVIIVLMLAFFIVLFLGKKDKKKIEQTQRLQTIQADAFKEVSQAVAVETAPPVVETSLNQVPVANEVPVVETPIVPEIPVISVDNSSLQTPVTPIVSQPVLEPTVPVVEQPVEEVVANPVINTIPVSQNVVNEETYKSPQSIDTLVEEKPVPKFNPDPVIEPYIPDVNLDNFEVLANSIDAELTALEKQQEIAKPIIDNIVPEASSAPVEQVIETPVAPVEPVIIPDVPEMVNVQTPSVAIVEPVISTPILTEIKPEPIKVEEPAVKTNPTKVVDVFSSVYVPPKKEETKVEEDLMFDDTMAIELPKLKG